MTDPAPGTQSASEDAAPHAADLEIEVELRAGAQPATKVPPSPPADDGDVPAKKDGND